ncbi:GyrI-like domain-containing protein [Pedobacter sp. LMG 31464]|uniref:GyrI-like domain-containing protein n=1 Tax=Pedobacter planticolens TaxID=2679964 RepID=A0A923E1W6_9SPHI|nr:GyrI-like domain-containing protein [Pedobacter planticolens]MBB2147175.1 GyrI-like domain-containing protein [Pedobacter planticolens]
MFLRTETISSKKLIGFSLKMSLANNKTFELWSKFMPQRKEIENTVGSDLYSIQVFDNNYNQFDPQSIFEKWAAIEVTGFEDVPTDMVSFILPAGKYAVFLHKGSANEGYKTFQYIFGVWLPNSGYELDNRPHFEILGEKYKNNDPSSEEEVFIPIR